MLQEKEAVKSPGKLSYSYLIDLIIDGNLEKRLGNLEKEIREKADSMVADLMRVKGIPVTKKIRLEYLYALAPKEEQTSRYKAKCRNFYKGIVRE